VQGIRTEYAEFTEFFYKILCELCVLCVKPKSQVGIAESRYGRWAAQSDKGRMKKNIMCKISKISYWCAEKVL
jgi:hypothetical protein